MELRVSTDLPLGVNELTPPDRVEIHVSTVLFLKRQLFLHFAAQARQTSNRSQTTETTFAAIRTHSKLFS